MKSPVIIASVLTLLFTLSACGGGSSSYPQSPEDIRKDNRGKLTGDGLTLFGGDSAKGGGASPIGVNSFLWRATLDTLSFMPLTSADPFGGVIITDWYEDPKAPGERFKVNALILDQQLRSDGIKISLFKQQKDVGGVWRDADVNPRLGRDIEDTILTRARQLNVSQGQ
jgi:hypothetical protein